MSGAANFVSMKHCETIYDNITKGLNRTAQPRCLPKHLNLQDAGIPWHKVCHGSTILVSRTPQLIKKRLRKKQLHIMSNPENRLPPLNFTWRWACQAANLVQIKRMGTNIKLRRRLLDSRQWSLHVWPY